MLRKILWKGFLIAIFIMLGLAIPSTPHTEEVFHSTTVNDNKYIVKIISYLPKVDRPPYLLRVTDGEAGVVIWLVQNHPYYIVTGIALLPISQTLLGGNGNENK